MTHSQSRLNETFAYLTRRVTASLMLAGALTAAPSEAQWVLSPQPTLRIGSDASPEYEFTRIQHLRRLSDGRILVTTGPDIRFFDAAGRYLSKAGGRGRGPGEFQYISDLRVLPGDTLLTLNIRTIIVLDRDGKFVRQSQPDLAPLAVADWFSEGQILMPNGNLLAPQYSREQGATPSPTLRRPRIRVAILDLRTATVTPLHTGGGFAQQNINGIPMVQAFTPHERYVVGADRVYVGDNDSTSIHAFDLAGRPVGTFVVATEATPVTDAELERQKQSGIEWATRNNRMTRAAFEQVWDASTKPRRHPYWGEALVDDTGVLWISGPPRGGDTPITWTAFDRSGRRLGAITVPAKFAPKHIGADFVLGVQRDEDDVETISMYALRRP